MSEVANTEKLIELVRERSLLYDLSHADYKNRDKKAEAWLDVAAAMGFGEGKIWTAKWKSLKDNYNKFKKYNESSTDHQAYKKYKSWPWASQMTFLDDCNVRRTTESNSQPIANNLHSSVDESKITTHGIPEDAAGSQITRKRMKTSADRSDKILDYLKQKNEPKSKLDGVDYLFLSYAQTFKTFPTRVQSMLKLEMATMFARYELQVEGGCDASVSRMAAQSSHQAYGSCSSTPNSWAVPSPDYNELEGPQSAQDNSNQSECGLSSSSH